MLQGLVIAVCPAWFGWQTTFCQSFAMHVGGLQAGIQVCAASDPPQKDKPRKERTQHPWGVSCFGGVACMWGSGAAPTRKPGRGC